MNILPNEIIDIIILSIPYPDIIKFRKYLTRYAYYKSMSTDIIKIVQNGDIVNLNYIKKDIEKISYTIFDIIVIHSSFEKLYDLLLWSYYNNYTYSIMTLNIISFLDCNIKKEIVLKFLYNKKYKFNKIHYSIAVKTNNMELIKFLTRIGIEKDHTIIDYAISQKNFKMIKWLVENNIGNDINLFVKLIRMNIDIIDSKNLQILDYVINCEYIPINIKKISESIQDKTYLKFVFINLLSTPRLPRMIEEEILRMIKNL